MKHRATGTMGAAVAALAILFCAGAQAGVHRYEVTVDARLEQLTVHACFQGRAPEYLIAESDGAHFYLESMRLIESNVPAARALEARGEKVALGASTDDACVDYAVKLQPAQTSVQTGGPETRRIGGSMLTSFGEWLWRAPDTDAVLELRFRLPAGIEVSTPWKRDKDAAGALFLVGPTPPDWSGIVAFGRFAPHDIAVDGAILHVALVGLATDVQARFDKWIEGAAHNAIQLYGKFPVESLQVVVAPTPRGRGPVPWAYVARGGGPAIHLFVNPARPPAEFEQDWSLTHEMSHLFLPYIVSRDAWLYEGVPTYLQNTLMARGGAISADEAWERMHAGFRRGALTAPHLSLARANERVGFGPYLRVYWGGAALMLEADLRLRKQSGGKQSLDTALAQLNRCCAGEQRRWAADEIIARIDELTGSTVFSEIVRRQFGAEGFPDYEAVFAQVGVGTTTGVTYDASAPWAVEREAVMRPLP
ncbi:MAG: hypothetical protein ABI771_04210 [Betaproteobacteria bacterium]